MPKHFLIILFPQDKLPQCSLWFFLSFRFFINSSFFVFFFLRTIFIQYLIGFFILFLHFCCNSLFYFLSFHFSIFSSSCFLFFSGQDNFFQYQIVFFFILFLHFRCNSLFYFLSSHSFISFIFLFSFLLRTIFFSCFF